MPRRNRNRRPAPNHNRQRNEKRVSKETPNGFNTSYKPSRNNSGSNSKTKITHSPLKPVSLNPDNVKEILGTETIIWTVAKNGISS